MPPPLMNLTDASKGTTSRPTVRPLSGQSRWDKPPHPSSPSVVSLPTATLRLAFLLESSAILDRFQLTFDCGPRNINDPPFHLRENPAISDCPSFEQCHAAATADHNSPTKLASNPPLRVRQMSLEKLLPVHPVPSMARWLATPADISRSVVPRPPAALRLALVGRVLIALSPLGNATFCCAFKFSEQTGLPFFGEIGKELPFPAANNDAKLQRSRQNAETQVQADHEAKLQRPRQNAETQGLRSAHAREDQRRARQGMGDCGRVKATNAEGQDLWPAHAREDQRRAHHTTYGRGNPNATNAETLGLWPAHAREDQRRARHTTYDRGNPNATRWWVGTLGLEGSVLVCSLFLELVPALDWTDKMMDNTFGGWTDCYGLKTPRENIRRGLGLIWQFGFNENSRSGHHAFAFARDSHC
ncbi:uncharacterized protein J3D65DRAFT_685157 [Phyllosticta citribraziliensis]|uniref:Uncharacterized protein n=1 Tax=Phyllosticta citribraziliensis TaxID=989973 RepID=A0ABR1L9R5_9PEZI